MFNLEMVVDNRVEGYDTPLLLEVSNWLAWTRKVAPSPPLPDADGEVPRAL